MGEPLSSQRNPKRSLENLENVVERSEGSQGSSNDQFLTYSTVQDPLELFGSSETFNFSHLLGLLHSGNLKLLLKESSFPLKEFYFFFHSVLLTHLNPFPISSHYLQ